MNLATLPEVERQTLLRQLGNGTPPSNHAQEIYVGLKKWASIILKHDTNQIYKGAGCFRIIEGVAGSGKSFLFALTKEVMMESSVAVSSVALSPTRKIAGTAAKSLLTHIVASFSCQTVEAQSAVGLVAVLQHCKGQLERLNVTSADSLSERLDPIRSRPLGQDFIKAVTCALFEKNGPLRDLALSWLKAETESKSSLKPLGLATNPSGDHLFSLLQCWGAFFRSCDMRGLVVFMDELHMASETTTGQSAVKANATLMTWLDKLTTSQDDNLAIYMAATPAAISDKRFGLFKDEALRSRLKLDDESSNSVEQTLFKMKPFSDAAYQRLMSKLIELSFAGESPISPAEAEKFVRQTLIGEHPPATIREFTRSALSWIDTLRPDIDRVA